MRKIVILLAAIFLTACMSASEHANEVQNDGNISVGIAQKEIKIGMSGAAVIEVLGSPNIVSTDEQRREVWVYDKVSTNSVRSSSSGWVFAVLAGAHSRSGATSQSQSTLTIIIKFDEQSLVRDFAYHTSKF